jgi:MoaA/NifB/PqqE/SkfB family radical SAM enzyme
MSVAVRGGMALVLDVARAAFDRDRPLVTHLVITRRCNLSCGYCHEYDKTSAPVPTELLRERIAHLARLGSVFVTLTGGESLLHPDAAALVACVREHGMTPFLNTNGYLLTRAWIDSLNEAGLYAMQLSIDNVTPNAISKKSLKTLLPKLRLLKEHAKFRVRINCVLGSSPPNEALEVARTVVELGFDLSTSLMREGDGAMAPISPELRAAYDEIQRLGRRAPAYLSADGFTRELLDEGSMTWKCRAGARTFIVDEFGLVHLCAPRMGTPGKPLALYTRDDIRHYFAAPKPCAATCPVAYAHHASRLDGLRSQSGTPVSVVSSGLVQLRPRAA